MEASLTKSVTAPIDVGVARGDEERVEDGLSWAMARAIFIVDDRRPRTKRWIVLYVQLLHTRRTRGTWHDASRTRRSMCASNWENSDSRDMFFWRPFIFVLLISFVTITHTH